MADVCQRRCVSFTAFQISKERRDEVADEMVTRVMPSALACSYINPSTSLETAEVHSSRIA